MALSRRPSFRRGAHGLEVTRLPLVTQTAMELFQFHDFFVGQGIVLHVIFIGHKPFSD